MPEIRLIVGLGNPGKEYANTRHNVGFMVVDKLAARWRGNFSLQGKWKAEVAKCGNLYLLKPLTYMNLSGEAVAACRHFYKILPEEILVVYDEVALPLGKLRLRSEGSAGGHNGMKSLIQHLGTQNFLRMRLGIGGQEKSSLSGHVLGKFNESEQDSLNKMLDRSAEAIHFATLRGWPLAMNQFNADPTEAAKPKPPRPPKSADAEQTTAPAVEEPPTTLKIITNPSLSNHDP